MKRELPGIVLGDLVGTALFICLMLAVRAPLSAAAWVLLPVFFFGWILVMAFVFRQKRRKNR